MRAERSARDNIFQHFLLSNLKRYFCFLERVFLKSWIVFQKVWFHCLLKKSMKCSQKILKLAVISLHHPILLYVSYLRACFKETFLKEFKPIS